MTAVLDAVDERIQGAEQDVERTANDLHAARALVEQLEGERRLAHGRIGHGDASAVPDLAQLHQDYIAARAAVQDAERSTREAQMRVGALKGERKRIEGPEISVYLAPLLDLRTTLAEQFEAQLEALVRTSALYRGMVKESLRLGVLLGAPTLHHLHQHVDVVVARRLLLQLKAELHAECPNIQVSSEESLTSADEKAGTGMRARVAQTLGAARS